MDRDAPLLAQEEDAVDRAVDYKGRRVYRSSSGGWGSASFIIGVEAAERFAYYGVASNLISYLTGPLGQPMATAAENVNTWSGAVSLLPLLGAFVADSYLGRYRTIIIATIFYISGLGFLTITSLLPSDCQNTTGPAPCRPPRHQLVLFFFSLYVVAIGQAGHKPCIQAFGADQFDERDFHECKSKSSFFNWWYFGLCAGSLVTIPFLTYIQDNLGWGLGFGIPCVTMALSLVIFLLGTTKYRFTIKEDEQSPLVRIGRVFVATFTNRKASHIAMTTEEGIVPYEGTLQFKFLNRALVTPNEDGKVCSISDVEEAKAILGLVPIWSTCLVYAIVFAQSSTFFTKQGSTMDRSTGLGFNIPAASIQSFISLSIVVFIPIYDRVFVPIARSLTKNPSGITMLQRIGTGILLSILSMVIAALVEIKRLNTAGEHGLVDTPKSTIPMSILWLVPQYVMFGISDVFTMVGLQEFFYDQVPRELRSVGLSLYLSIFGIGNLLSSIVVSFIEEMTGGKGRESWFADNLNRAHLDYFYWLLAGLSAVGFIGFVYFAKSYTSN